MPLLRNEWDWGERFAPGHPSDFWVTLPSILRVTQHVAKWINLVSLCLSLSLYKSEGCPAQLCVIYRFMFKKATTEGFQYCENLLTGESQGPRRAELSPPTLALGKVTRSVSWSLLVSFPSSNFTQQNLQLLLSLPELAHLCSVHQGSQLVVLCSTLPVL